MAFWWVFQNKTYKEESEGSFLWAPKVNGKGKTKHYWETMTKLETGDIVFSCVKQKIYAISTVITPAYSHKKSFQINTDKLWENEGWKADLIFSELKTPIALKTIRDDIMPMMQYKYAPLDRNGGGNQGYMFSITDNIGNYLLSIIESKNDVNIVEKEIADIQRQSNISITEKDRLVSSRIGQGDFRKILLQYWNNQCSVTGLALPELLIASHIKPWKISNNRERLDGDNGLLLSPNYDYAFDKGYISFDADGTIIFSSKLSSDQKNALGFTTTSRIQKKLNHNQQQYLTYHRNFILN